MCIRDSIGIERYGEVQVVVDIELQRPGFQDALIPFGGLRDDVTLGTVSVGVDASVCAQLLQELRRKDFVQPPRHVPERILDSDDRIARRKRVAARWGTADAFAEPLGSRQLLRETDSPQVWGEGAHRFLFL